MNSSAYKKTLNALRKGKVAVIPTDTIYGLVGCALLPKTVENIYKLRRRNPSKPMIVLICSLDYLNLFGVKLTQQEEKILNSIWPGKVSVVLNCSKKFSYLHRGTGTIAFRLPRPRWLRNLLTETGPLIAPSANWEGYQPARTVDEAKKYFGNKVLYLGGGRLSSKSSTLVSLRNGKIKLLRPGAVSFKNIK